MDLPDICICSIYMNPESITAFGDMLVIFCHAMYFNFQAIGCVCVSSWHAEGGDSWHEGSGSQNGSSGFRVETVATASVFSVAAGNWCGPMGSLA